MAKTPSKKPKVREDANTTAFRTLQEALGESPKTPPPAEKNAAAVALGRRGGEARKKGMSKKQLSANAKKAANARWSG